MENMFIDLNTIVLIQKYIDTVRGVKIRNRTTVNFGEGC